MGAVFDSVLAVSNQIAIDAPRARVLAAWADPAAIARWYVERRRGDSRTDCRFMWYPRRETGIDDTPARSRTNTATTMRFDNDGSVRGNDSVLYVSISAASDGTSIRVEQRGLVAAAQPQAPRVASDWACALATLKVCLEADNDGRRQSTETLLESKTDPHAFAAAVASRQAIAEWAGDQPSRVLAVTPLAAVVTFHGLPGVVRIDNAGRVAVSHTCWGDAVGAGVKTRQLAALLDKRLCARLPADLAEGQ